MPTPPPIRIASDDEVAEIVYTAEQFARLVGKSIKTIYHWRYTGYGPRGFRIGRSVHYFKRDIDAWLRQLSDADTEHGTGQPA
ncbi:helix-turn-helix domain-containing protein [Streptomyces sp. TRM43335]|uniref:Helix-turn-helix domain-containing protein n=1 Tax=Streptomyces taklimakanensis TaxID=2569853 RepID=A0A6G2BEK0_9ACTN|nr:helix-turn-helix domain-containing protein [Streptomyces taklimakanensis]MTE20332.1 helix-turn-helix domain-containing protein [Streptomyces taklimakanensis]